MLVEKSCVLQDFFYAKKPNSKNRIGLFPMVNGTVYLKVAPSSVSKFFCSLPIILSI